MKNFDFNKFMSESIQSLIEEEREKIRQEAIEEVAHWVADTRPKGEILAFEILGEFRDKKGN